MDVIVKIFVVAIIKCKLQVMILNRKMNHLFIYFFIDACNIYALGNDKPNPI